MNWQAREWYLLLAVPALLVSVACGATLPGTGGSASCPTAAASTAFYCANPQPDSTVQGNPDVTAVPSLRSISLAPSPGGLLLSVKFRKPLVSRPKAFTYRGRSMCTAIAATPPIPKAPDAQVEDRGKAGSRAAGPSLPPRTRARARWRAMSIPTERATSSRRFSRRVSPTSAHLSTGLRSGGVQGVFTRDNKAAPQDWKINGAVYTDCPAGVRPDPNSAPYAAKLLTVVC